MALVKVAIVNPLPGTALWQVGMVPAGIPQWESAIYPWGGYLPISIPTRQADVPYSGASRLSFYVNDGSRILREIDAYDVTFVPGAVYVGDFLSGEISVELPPAPRRQWVTPVLVIGGVLAALVLASRRGR